MADVEKTAETLSKLGIRKLDQEWVKGIWDKDFTDVDPLPLDVEEDLQENDYHANTLYQAVRVLVPWVQGEEGSSSEGFWTVLVENEIPHRSLVAFLYYIMEIGQKRVSTAVQKEAGIVAATVYLNLAMVPGSGAFKVFHPMLFQQSLKELKNWTQIGTSTKRKRKSSPVAPSQSQRSQPMRKGRSSKRSKTAEPEPVEEDIFNDDGDEDDEEEQDVFSQKEIQKLNKRLLALLKDLVRFLQSYSLRESEDSVQFCLQILADLSRREPETFSGEFQKDAFVGHVDSVPHLAYIGFSSMIKPAHGEPPAMATSVFKYLMPSLLMLMGDSKAVAAQAIPRYVQIIKDTAVAYVCHLLKVSQEVVLPGVRTLLQHLCVKVPERSEYRAKVGQAVLTILKEMPCLQYARMIEWIFKYSKNAKIGYRVFALEVISILLSEPEREKEASLPAEYAQYLSHRFLLQIMLSRCSDAGPTVRARAIAAFAQCTASTDMVIKTAIKEIVTPRTIGRQPIARVIPTPDAERAQTAITDKTTISETESSKDGTQEKTVATEEGAAIPEAPLPVVKALTPGGFGVTVQLTPGAEITLPDGQGMVSMLRRRAGDEKVNVRKAALLALENIVRMDGDCLNKEDLDVLAERCRDPALSVRKQAMQSLTDLLHDIPNNKTLQEAWLDGVLPLVLDRETTAQEKCMDTLEELIIQNVVPANRSTGSGHQMAWNLLTIMAGNNGVDLRRFLQKAFQFWARVGKLKATFITALQTHVGTENNAAVWMVLAELAPFAPKYNPKFVIDYWHEHAKSATESEYGTVRRVLVVLGCLAKHLDKDIIKPLTVDLKERLTKFNSPPELISITVSTLSKLCNSLSGGGREEGKKMNEEWCIELLGMCDRYLSHVILNENPDAQLNEDLIVKHLFTVGEIAQLCPGKTPKRIFMLVQSLIAAPVITSVDGSSQPDPSVSSQSSQSNQSAGSQALSQGIEVLSQFRGSRMSSKIRSHAFVTLGKLCLQNEDIAKKCVAAMARELEICTDPAIRNNVVVIMCDLCVRYTTLVDHYVCNIASCLRDENPLIRKQTLTMITHLLQEDFLKWKGTLFFRFVTAIVDEDEDIRAFADFCLIHILHKRHPAMFFQHFIECIFHFNSYDGHSAYNKFSQTEREKKLFSFKGSNNASKRMTIYRFMLEQMSDEHRFHLTAKIGQDILGAMVDDIIPLDVESSAILQDSLAILCCKEIKLSSMRSKPQEDVIESEQDMAAAVMEKAKKTLISAVVKKNVIENIVPIVISLKHILEKQRSPLLRDLMMFLQELMKDYKNEVKEIMSGDKQLANEIEFDLRRFEEQQIELEKQKQQKQAQQQGGPLSPGRLAQGAGRGSPRAAAAAGSPKGPSVGSPRSVATAGGSPAAASKVPSPRIQAPQSPKGNSPVMALVAGTPKSATATPARAMSMSTMAIINSARKAMATAKRITEARNSPQPKPKTPAPAAATATESGKRPAVLARPPIHPTSYKTPNKENQFKTPDRVRRAISTPQGNIGDITFAAADANMSMIPPSPIPTSLPLRLYSNNAAAANSGPKVPGTPSWTAKLDDVEKEQQDKDVIYMFSPDHPLPKPKQWNIKTVGTENKEPDEDKGPKDKGPKDKQPLATSKKNMKEKEQNTSSSASTRRSSTRSSSRRK